MRRAALLAGVSLLVLGTGIELTRLNILPKIDSSLVDKVQEQIIWGPDSPASVQERYAGGTTAPPLYVRYYLYNITNVDKVRKGGKPVLEEVGPFTYTKHRAKLNIQFSEDNATVSFSEYYYYLPAPDLSAASPSDALITTLNVPLVGAIEVIRSRLSTRWAPWLQLLAKLVEGWADDHVSGLFTTRSAEELLWGYDDPLLKKAAHLIPGSRFSPRFSLAHNMTAPPEAAAAARDEVITGAEDLKGLWQYISWHGVEEVTSWAPPHIEKVQGTDATQFRPGLKGGDELQAWVGEAFRAAILVQGVGRGQGAAPEQRMSVGGVPVLRFRPDPAQRQPDPRYYQQIKGLMNVTSPMAAGPSGSPSAAGPRLFLSLPGYCHADGQLAAGVDGVSCDPERHDVYMDVEPTTGITLRAQKALMLSSWFGEDYNAVEAAVQDTFLPIFWAQESSEASAQQLAAFRPMLWAQRAQRVLRGAAWPASMAAWLMGALSLMALPLLPVRRRQLQQGGDQAAAHEEDEVEPLVEPPAVAAPPVSQEEIMEEGDRPEAAAPLAPPTKRGGLKLPFL